MDFFTQEIKKLPETVYYCKHCKHCKQFYSYWGSNLNCRVCENKFINVTSFWKYFWIGDWGFDYIGIDKFIGEGK